MVNYIIKIILCILFALCLADMPYGYFQAVRFLGMVGFVILAYTDNKDGKNVMPIIWIASALLINPFFKVALGRTIWNITDVIWTIILVITLIADIMSCKKQNIKAEH